MNNLNNNTQEHFRLIKHQKMLLEQFQSGNQPEVFRLIEVIIADLQANSSNTKELIQKVCLEILIKISQLFTENEKSFSDLFELEDEVIKGIFRADTIQDMEEHLKRYLNYCWQTVRNFQKQKYFTVINKAKAFINDNLIKDISLNEVADYVNLSPNYFCNIFKQQTGSNLSNYILNVKMQRAKQYLLTTDFKIYQIAEKVGYKNSDYFCTVFKKYYHMSPLQYKNNLKHHELDTTIFNIHE